MGALLQSNWRPTPAPLAVAAFSSRRPRTLAAHNHYSVCTTWLLSKGCYYLLDVIRGKYELPELKARAIEAARKWKANGVLVEGVGTGLIAELRQAGISAPF
jgi:phage terminase large subunit-like protein